MPEVDNLTYFPKKILIPNLGSTYICRNVQITYVIITSKCVIISLMQKQFYEVFFWQNSKTHPEEFYSLSFIYLIEQSDCFFFQCQLYVNGNLAAELSRANQTLIPKAYFILNTVVPILSQGVYIFAFLRQKKTWIYLYKA